MRTHLSSVFNSALGITQAARERVSSRTYERFQIEKQPTPPLTRRLAERSVPIGRKDHFRISYKSTGGFDFWSI